jgi:hypothetical protein
MHAHTIYLKRKSKCLNKLYTESPLEYLVFMMHRIGKGFCVLHHVSRGVNPGTYQKVPALSLPRTALVCAA